MTFEDTSSEHYSDVGQPSHSSVGTANSTLDLSAFHSRTLPAEPAATCTFVNSSTLRLGTSDENSRICSINLTQDSPSSVEDCVNSLGMETGCNSPKVIPNDLPQLPAGIYSASMHDLHPLDGESVENSDMTLSQGQGNPDHFSSFAPRRNSIPLSAACSQSGMYQPPGYPIELLSYGTINSPTEGTMLAAHEIEKEEERLSPANEMPSASISGQGRTPDIGLSADARLCFSAEQGEISEDDGDLAIPANNTSQVARAVSVSGKDFAALSFIHGSANEPHSDYRTAAHEQGRTTTQPDGSIINEIDENNGNDEFERIGQDGRVDIESLPVMTNPLQKAGRHTVIRGRLANDHPFSIAANNLGYKLVSKEHNGKTGSLEETERRKTFMQDLKTFLKEIGNRHFKIPVIGGGDLDIYSLTKEVMLLGGVQNVVRKRAFRIVAQQLGIPKTCTSAASVLKGAYERLLFHYEQRLVFGKWPENPTKAVNMKERVCEEKIKERRTRTCLQMRARRKGEKAHRQQQLATRRGLASSTENETVITSNSHDRRLPNSDRLVRLATEDNSEYSFELPAWAQNMLKEQGYEGLIAAVQRIDATNVHNRSEIVLIAMAECFEVATSTNGLRTTEKPHQDLCLARIILALPAETPSIRKAHGFLFNLLAMAISAPDGISLASNNSAEGLVDGLLSVLREFHQSYLQSEAQTSPWAVEDVLPFTLEHDVPVRQDIAQAYCALRVLAGLSNNGSNRARLFLRADLLRVYTAFLTYPNTHRTFILPILDAMSNGSSLLSACNQPEILLSLSKALLAALDKSAGLESDANVPSKNGSEPTFDFDISRRVLQTLCSFSPEWGLDASFVPTFMSVVARLLFVQHKVDALDAVAELAFNLATAHPKLAAEHETFVPGILQLLHSGRCLDFAVETLCVIHTAHPLHAHKEEMRGLCQWQLLSDTQVHSLSQMLEDLVGTQDKVSSPKQEAALIKREPDPREHDDQNGGAQNDAESTHR